MIHELFGTAAGLRRRLTIAILLGLPAFLLAACTPAKPFIPEASQVPFGQGRIWQVEAAGFETSYVFAAYDLPDKRALALPQAAETAFQEAEVLAFEGLGDPYIQAEIYKAENLELTGDQTLRELIGSRSFGILSWHMNRRQLAPNNKAKPWVMWFYLGGENFGFTEHDGFYQNRADQTQVAWLEDRAAKAEKDVVGLQTDREYFDIYDKMPLDQQADMLRVRLDRYAERPIRTPKASFYVDGDLARLNALWQEYLSWLEPATARTLDDNMVNNRNRSMVERMLPLMREQPTFVAVGALHLPGEMGILRLLEQQGFTVVPLR